MPTVSVANLVDLTTFLALSLAMLGLLFATTPTLLSRIMRHEHAQHLAAWLALLPHDKTTFWLYRTDFDEVSVALTLTYPATDVVYATFQVQRYGCENGPPCPTGRIYYVTAPTQLPLHQYAVSFLEFATGQENHPQVVRPQDVSRASLEMKRLTNFSDYTLKDIDPMQPYYWPDIQQALREYGANLCSSDLISYEPQVLEYLSASVPYETPIFRYFVSQKRGFACLGVLVAALAALTVRPTVAVSRDLPPDLLPESANLLRPALLGQLLLILPAAMVLAVGPLAFLLWQIDAGVPMDPIDLYGFTFGQLALVGSSVVFAAASLQLGRALCWRALG